MRHAEASSGLLTLTACFGLALPIDATRFPTGNVYRA
jgi:hypothetical protein